MFVLSWLFYFTGSFGHLKGSGGSDNMVLLLTWLNHHTYNLLCFSEVSHGPTIYFGDLFFFIAIYKNQQQSEKTKTAPVYRSYLVVLLLKNIFSLSYYCCCFQAINWKIHDPVSSIQLQLIVIVLPLSSGSKRGYKRQHERMCGSKGLQQFKREWVVWAELNDFCATVSS